MIVPMKRLVLLCRAKDADRTLESLRDLKCAHLDLGAPPSSATQAVDGELADVERAVRILEKAAGEPAAVPPLGKELRTVADVLSVDARLRELADAHARLARTVAAYEPYGDFDPELARELLSRGIDLASVAELPDPLPAERLSVTRGRLAENEAETAGLKAALYAARGEISRLTDLYPALCERRAFSAARDALGREEDVAWILGWLPQDAVPAVRARAVREGWGLLVRDPAADEVPPTCIRPPKLFRPVVALFEGLGISPAYTEADVSVPFLCYFAIFFAMLVGDGAYGTIFLLATLWGWRKTRPAPGAGHRPRLVRSWLTLMTVFSTATVAWGLLSNTWFGAGIPACRDWPTVTWLADPSYNNMMLLCFTIGVSHLMLARLWNGIARLNDTSCLAEFGWAGVLLTMYLVTNAIVGIFPAFPSWGYAVGGLSLVLVFGFTVKPCELKTRGIELGMLPLNVMSALGDIISYVRLFAVGLASVKVAENFNAMAVGFVQGEHAWWMSALFAVAMVAVLLVGHGLNLAMAGLSILVHAVRLNTLEFSNHKGVSWAGYAYRPFARK